MKRILYALAILAPLVLATGSRADSSPPVPFPAPHVHGVFVSTQTVTATGQVSDYFAPGDTVVFQAYAIDTKVHKLLTKKYSKREFMKLRRARPSRGSRDASLPSASTRSRGLRRWWASSRARSSRPCSSRA